MSDNYLKQEQLYAFREQQLFEREEQIRRRELDLEQAFKEFEIKKLGMQRDLEEIRRSEY